MTTNDAARPIDRIRKVHGSEAGMFSAWGTSVKADTQNGNRDMVVIATTADIDLEGEVVVPGGADWSYFLKNKTVFLDHRYESEYVIGTMRDLHAIKSPSGEVAGWRMRYRVATSALGDDFIRMVKGGTIPGASIGFTASDRGSLTDDERKRYTKGGNEPRSIVRKWNGLEVSATYMPCNVACQSDAPSWADESKLATLDGLVTKGLIRRESALAFGLHDAAPRCIILV